MRSQPIVETRENVPYGHVTNRHGLALAATLLVLAMMGVLVAAAVRAAMTSVRTAGLEYHEARVFYAAEAGGEAALAQLRLALLDGYLSDAELSGITTPTINGFDYDSFSVERQGSAVVENITDGPYTGLYALTQIVDIYSRAEDANGTTAGIVLRAKARAIPIFQFGVFFEKDLEATNGPPMEFMGRVHSNGNIYLSSPNAWYRDMITTPNKVFWDRKDYHKKENGVFINDAAANEVKLSFDSRSIADPQAFKNASCADFDCRLQTDAFGVDSLKLPLPPGVPPIELIRPREASDQPAEKEVKFAWTADTYITVDLTTLVDVTALCGVGADQWQPTITLDRGSAPVPSPADVCKIFPWKWSAFHDGRELELKDVLTIDIVELTNWVGGDPARTMEVVFVNFVLPADIDVYPMAAKDLILDATVDPAVRLRNGVSLPNRMTIATEFPLYVQANYNSVPGGKLPAALAGDGITILSTAWLDDQNRPPTGVFGNCQGQVTAGKPCNNYTNWNWTYQNAAQTTVNAAILAGHWPTPCDHEDAGCSGGYEDFYGGGIENFPRFLERWGGGVRFRYLGALISPFTSAKTTGTWNMTYYVPPMRDWAFDTDFRDPNLLPPGTPNVGNVVRTAMREAF